MTSHLMQIVGLFVAGVIFWRAESVLNMMTRNCRLFLRVAFCLLAVGAAALALQISQGYTPPAAVVLLLAGMALLLVSERRMRAVLRINTPVQHERRVNP